jgi:acyl-CoA synthetase (AMP-forming)/AMP-acid ligase II
MPIRPSETLRDSAQLPLTPQSNQTAQASCLAAASLTVADRFDAQVQTQPNAVAIESDTRLWTYAQLSERSVALACVLTTLKVGRDDRVAILAENCAEYVAVFLAAARLGAIVACQNWRQADPELTHCLNLVRPAIIIVSERFAHTVERLKIEAVAVLSLAQLDRMMAPHTVSGEPAKVASLLPALQNAVDPEAGLLLLYTSGTTGLPKAALISHRAVIARSLVYALDRAGSSSSVFVAWTPFFHMGSTDPTLATLMAGGKVIVLDGFDAERLVEIVVHEHVGHLNLVPGVIERFLAAWNRRGAQPLKVDSVGVMADLVPPRLIAELTAALKAPYCNTFGSTETGSPPASRAVVEVGVVPDRHQLAKQQSSLCSIRLLDAQDQEVDAGCAGEVAMRGPTLFSGYWNADDVNAEVFRDGWYRMGDMMLRNLDGTLDFVDRKKYLIKSGGENIYPAEIERVLLAMPEVAEAVVVRRLDQQWGEVPIAFVVRLDPNLTEARVIEACQGVIANYKRPKAVHFVDGESLPRNVSGKVERHKLEAWLAAQPDTSSSSLPCSSSSSSAASPPLAFKQPIEGAR